MDKIDSFTIDHTRLKRGIYVSRRDTVGSQIVTTFDLRMKEPNNEPALDSASAHTIYHIGATFLRNHKEFGNSILYFGPMGCLTGFYLLLADDVDSKQITSLIRELFKHVADFTGEIPGASPIECGNYTLMNLPEAQREAEKYYLQILQDIQQKNLVYPE